MYTNYIPSSSSDRAANVEFINSCSFLDTNQVCCGLCGEIVDYDKLLTEHLPHAHPEYQSQEMQLEEIPYTSWLKDRLKRESKFLENGFRNYDDPHQHQIGSSAGFGGAPRLYTRNLRQMRKVSQIRVNVNEMSMSQLETALKRKLIEKMGRKVPVSLVDRLHARCDICQAVVSLNKKFEVIHLVRHFNAWHPAEHRCSQEWKEVAALPNPGARHPLSLHDFAVVSTETDQNNLQCIWCGMFMDRAALGMHFSEIHTQQHFFSGFLTSFRFLAHLEAEIWSFEVLEIIVPNCSLCLQEMVMTARFMEKYGKDFGISLPDEFHLQSSKLGAKYSSEKAMDKAIEKHLKRIAMKGGADQSDGGGGGIDDDDDDQTISITNSQQSFGRRNRLKRKFVKPCFRQVCPPNSEFFEPKSACEWRCRLCNRFVYAAVISAGAIKHFKEFHPAEIDKMQYELVKYVSVQKRANLDYVEPRYSYKLARLFQLFSTKLYTFLSEFQARLERIGDGSMEFVHPQLVECLICNLTYALHKPFNICRAIRHLRLKHPEVMPETSGKSISGAEIAETVNLKAPVMTNPSTASTAAAAKKRPNIRFGDCITDPIELEKFRKENWDQQFDKVQVVYGIKKNDEPAFILLMDNEQMDEKTAMEMAEKEQENGKNLRISESQRLRISEVPESQESQNLRGSEAQNLRISESQNLRISESQNLRISESQNLRISESQNLRISESQNLRISESQNLRISESQNLRISESQNLRISESQNPRISESQNLRISESQNLRISESQNLRISESQNLRISESQNLRISESQNLRIPESQNLRVSESQNIINSESQNLRISDSQNLRISESQNLRISEFQNFRNSEFQNFRNSEFQNFRNSESPEFFEFRIFRCNSTPQTLGNSLWRQHTHNSTDKCDKTVDKYIEQDVVLVVIDLMLQYVQAYRHLLLNVRIQRPERLFVMFWLSHAAEVWIRERENREEQTTMLADQEWMFYRCLLLSAVEISSFVFVILLFWKLKKDETVHTWRQMISLTMLGYYGEQWMGILKF
ncbi:LOW QUALITY PROTEIN: Protein CBG00931 [Caenorhabditis briggsae]|uniref:Protein ARV n=1 Tax=Caenorhabditis briggsae TaxID=6238 RepID=A8WPB0_CAEBR|nr:LOW QUALITY PROTEIN: Protein CBG00931 [Caenorhabditis briggsae]CAP22316.1 Protein CBG00931 [Caenorhabditis briggsae]